MIAHQYQNGVVDFTTEDREKKHGNIMHDLATTMITADPNAVIRSSIPPSVYPSISQSQKVK